MKKYSSGSFTDAAVRIYGSEADTLTSFPASIIANGGNITPWTVFGNTVEGVSVGDRTANLINIADISETVTVFYKDTLLLDTIDEGSYTLSFNTTSDVPHIVSVGVGTTVYSKDIKTLHGVQNGHYTIDFAISAEDSGKNLYVRFVRFTASTTVTYTVSKIMLNTGETALPYEPYGYKLPVVIGSNTTNIYMADVLRKSTGADPVYDIMSSTGVITRNVDTDGTPLLTPTTESFTAPTLATVAGSQSVSFDTTIKPSKAELTYTGWHTHSDKKRSGGAWT